MEHTVYFSIGSNIGNRKRLIHNAIELLGNRVGPVLRQSSLIETEPWGFSSPNMFLNACVCCQTTLEPRQVLRVAQAIEKELGRTGKTVDGDYCDRVIDIDILLYDDVHIDEPDLKIPHPLMHQRDFVMTPLKEILPH
ncbi:MAG: 2-amino-4-hydroxy-6-hydroxymethyldihydropteridine diphosphokinase [Prevotella sp.]|jgi:2-amino-4-hydroxy-6-hydroxymethyldihydropteridine diphosphokinase|nr:2-amino-4-hydroxy-6-hydroxymethyldihydropteridine diphosphokinase [Prevotella sp.]MDY6241254.1 2-amino-4-hydroxy-6-hydroxymethyldihydropteridine diphosphokinase [Prevotella sp.]